LDEWLTPEASEGLSAEESALALRLSQELERSLDPRELRRRGRTGLTEIVLAGVGLLRSLRSDEIRVRVENPNGHRKGRTVVEVATRDRPFLVDTLRLNLRRLGLRERLLLHPLLPLERDPDGSLLRVEKEGGSAPRDAYLYAEIPLVRDEERRRALEATLVSVYENVKTIVGDHRQMVKALRRHVAEIECAAPNLPGGIERADRLIRFLDWLGGDRFIFFGYRYYQVFGDGNEQSIVASDGSGLGILRDESRSRFTEERSGDDIPSIVRARLADRRLVFYDKSRNDATIHRPGKLDCISVKTIEPDGRVSGFGQFVGLLSYRALRTRGSEISILRERQKKVLAALGVEHHSHTYKIAEEAYDSLPVEVLFQFAISDVTRAVERIVKVTEQGGLGVYLLPDPVSRSFFVSAILPRSRYDESIRRDLEKLLRTKYGATYTDHRVSFLDDEVALIHFFCSAERNLEVGVLNELERDVEERVSGWEDGLEAALLELHPEEPAFALVDEYGSAFPEVYQRATSGGDSVRDVDALERVRAGGIDIELDIQPEPGTDLCRLKVYQQTRPYLTDLLPKLDDFGLRVLDAMLTEVKPASIDSLWIVTFRVDGLSDVNQEANERLLEALRLTLAGRLDVDALHRLVLGVGLDWREINLLRAYFAYAKQLRTSPGKPFTASVLCGNPDATRTLLRLFQVRFDPGLSLNRAEAEADCLNRLKQSRTLIRTAAEDRVFALLANLITSTVRTSYYTDAEDGTLLALKIDPSRVERMPAPRPYAEIFVHSAAMSGIHLRGGPIARGGIRWSDRPSDFRTEVLGLMKTQMVKNGLIVPVGSKGGFVVRGPVSDPRSAVPMAEEQYVRFIRALLSLTDQRVSGEVIPAKCGVRHDGDDPYLVVAPDKGTARFSDLANREAEAAGFWLGDAFASGGSEGYDHKKEGITARGAWVCVQRHFRELGIDVDRETYTAVGIGDMAGDVFGNGMLLARKAKMVAAFNHLHVFLDPAPDPEVAWAERSRLFDGPASGWGDYDTSKISEGGGVFDRSAKEVPLSPQVRQMLDTDAEIVSVEELIRLVLSMPVDLLWNGGIGTYVKAADESHADVGDTANDAVRVDARDLRARVVGEGGNLGFTQLARVEFALGGGRMNTDAVDNSGGVDMSDHEVNFKILAAQAFRGGSITREERNRILTECLGEAVDAVLSNSASQSVCISLDERRALEDPEGLLAATSFLARHAGLDPDLEGLPTPDDVRARAARGGPGYTRPELSVLLGFTKMLAQRLLLESDYPELPIFGDLLRAYFPQPLRERFVKDIAHHPLHREITATVLSNRVVDRAGVMLIPGLVEDLGVSPADAIAGYRIAGMILDAERLRDAVMMQPATEDQRLEVRLQIETAVRAVTRVLLGLERDPPRTQEALERWQRGRGSLKEGLPCESAEVRARVDSATEELCGQGFGLALARELAWLPALVRTLPALPLAERIGAPFDDVVGVWVQIGEATRVGDLLDRLETEGHRGGWDRLAAEALALELIEVQRELTEAAVSRGAGGTDAFLAERSEALERIASTVDRMENSEGPALAPAAFLVQQLRRLC
jgi:glutamate dehydrogenase